MGSRKRPAATLKADDSLCSFCQQTPAVINVERPLPHRLKKRYSQPLCLLHYYSTSAVREKAQYVSILDPVRVQEQLPSVQELFAEAFVQLQQKLQDETLQSLSSSMRGASNKDNEVVNDPLAAAVVWNKSSSRTQRAPRPKKVAQNDQTEGGFLREIPLPERLLRTQQQQAKKQKQLTLRMQKAATDTTQRRQPSRQSIWNVVLENPNKSKAKMPPLDQESEMKVHAFCAACGSQNVQSLGNMTSRNGDMAKGETWGSKDRGDDIVVRYQCQKCGHVWNETE